MDESFFEHDTDEEDRIADARREARAKEVFAWRLERARLYGEPYPDDDGVED